MKRFKYAYYTPPIDFWGNAIVADEPDTIAVLSQMPERPKDGTVYKLFLPYPNGASIEPIFLCKADNNGTVYIFSDKPVFKDGYFEEVYRI